MSVETLQGIFKMHSDLAKLALSATFALQLYYRSHMMGGFDKHIMKVWKTSAQEVKQRVARLSSSNSSLFLENTQAVFIIIRTNCVLLYVDMY